MPTIEMDPIAVEIPCASILDLSAHGLEQMFDRKQQLFCFTMRQGTSGLIRTGVSPRYTMMTLLGLHRWEQSGQRSPVPLSPVLDRLLSDTSWLECLGDLGLLLWTCAILSPDRLAGLVESTRPRDAINRYPDGSARFTMELAWFLTGLSYSLRTKVAPVSALHIPARQAFELLTANQGSTAIFGHLARTKSIPGLLRGPIGSFADQVYPIYALAQFGVLTDNREALGRASACAQTICNLQGPNGEWWWHYDANRRDVIDTYPVYSVHQDGMAPMALFALSDATGFDFSRQIAKGLSWITGRNDMGYDMRCASSQVIWRNLQLARREQYLRRLVPSRQGRPTSPTDLEVNRECRPYELGWALYALSGRELA